MWCQSGYITLRDVFEACFCLAEVPFLSAEQPEDLREAELDDEDGESWHELFFEAYGNWAFLHFTDAFDAGYGLCLPTGQTVLLARTLWPARIGNSAEPFPHSATAWKEINRRAEVELRYISKPTFTFSASFGRDRAGTHAGAVSKAMSAFEGAAWCIPWKKKGTVADFVANLVGSPEPATKVDRSEVSSILELHSAGLKKPAIKERLRVRTH